VITYDSGWYESASISGIPQQFKRILSSNEKKATCHIWPHREGLYEWEVRSNDKLIDHSFPSGMVPEEEAKSAATRAAKKFLEI
jgi:hypothetical protein